MAKEKKSTMISDVRQKTHESVDKIMDKAEDMRDDSNEEIDRLKEKANTIKENVSGYIVKNPEKSVLIALGVGAVAGLMISAMMRRRQ